MKINISRQNLYILILSLFLFLFVLLFAFLLLIPEGKEYRIQRAQLKKISNDVRSFDNFNSETLELLKKLQGDNRHIITAFDSSFSVEKFQKQHVGYFNSLSIAPKAKSSDEEGFTTYDVNTTSQMNSPKSFYDFLEAINKSDWIVGINFPIEFKREDEMIRATFSMKVYSNPKDANLSK